MGVEAPRGAPPVSDLWAVAVGGTISAVTSSLLWYAGAHAEREKLRIQLQDQRAEDRFAVRWTACTEFTDGLREANLANDRFEEEHPEGLGDFTWGDGEPISPTAPAAEMALAKLRLVADRDLYSAAADLLDAYYLRWWGYLPDATRTTTSPAIDYGVAEEMFYSAAKRTLAFESLPS